MNLHDFEETVRTQILMVAEPGPLAGTVIEKIIAAGKAYAGQSTPRITAPLEYSAEEVLATIERIKQPLIAALPEGRWQE
jgi:hypothetical protein